MPKTAFDLILFNRYGYFFIEFVFVIILNIFIGLIKYYELFLFCKKNFPMYKRPPIKGKKKDNNNHKKIKYDFSFLVLETKL